MKTRLALILTACACAGAYLVSKVDLAMRGELGLPGFPADPAAYAQYNPLWGQLSNAAASLVLIALLAALFALPRNRLLRGGLLAANWIALLVVTSGCVTFAVRAAGWAPGLGAPAIGWQTWATLAVGTVWIVTWVGGLLATMRGDRGPRPVAPTADPGLSGSTRHQMGQT